MSDKTIQAKLNDIAVILFDSPFKPALSKRKDFIIDALVVFLVRLPLCYILLSLALDIEFSISNGDVGYIILALLSLLGSAIFYAPFCFVFFRRLKGVGFTHPRLATWLLFIAIVIFSLFAMESAITIEIIATLLHVLPYLVLMIFKDKKTQIIAE